MLTCQQTMEYLKSQCMKRLHGECRTVRCIRLAAGDMPGSHKATCEYDMAYHYMEQAGKAREAITR